MIKESSKCVLVIIDAQERLMPVIADNEAVSKTIQDLVRFANIMEIPVLVSEQQNLGPTLEEISGLIKDFQPTSKISFSCFDCEEFSAALEKTGADTLIIAGVEAHICVCQTALDALGRYDVHVVADAVSSRTDFNLQAALDRLRQEGAAVTTKEMLFYEILKRAGTPQFKETLKLVK
ncbi:Isochorismatase family protein [Desulfatibacillum alkenivorans DSM 16219]|jgi:nicotinamidase-related amidase|uniref:Isochorismatase family protein n=1 Tax=Desulfatibacillum alkenivorans DSM 16219 TaxID=1121393 RepID=A0A1M6GTP1_9BACT|nr:isochorismatase family protein [Desulfatibacillum alkenivorans]SHJ13308.1 Isochorismatase family protein [Desulfatibacillum alkenivorans DSM 16219]